MARIDLYRRGRLVRSLTLADRIHMLGRDPDCDLVLDDPLASRRHAELLPGIEGSWILQDLDTPNGTRVDGVREFNVHLWSDATLQVGEDILLFFAAEEALPEAEPELPAWAIQLLAGEDSGGASETEQIAPTELRRRQAQALARARPHLVWTRPPGVQVLPLDHEVNALGFGHVTCSLGPAPRDEVVAELRREDGGYRLRARGWRSQVVVNGQRTRDRVLADGDRLEVCGERFEYRTGLRAS